MLYDDIWEEAGMTYDGYLCVACLERRLGRPLAVDDLASAVVNLPHPWDTPRLCVVKQALLDELDS